MSHLPDSHIEVEGDKPLVERTRQYFAALRAGLKTSEECCGYRDKYSRRTPLESAAEAERWCARLPAKFIGTPLTQEPVTLLLEMVDAVAAQQAVIDAALEVRRLGMLTVCDAETIAAEERFNSALAAATGKRPGMSKRGLTDASTGKGQE